MKTKKSKKEQNKIRNLIGKTVKYEYFAPAISCCVNGKKIKGEGKITRIRHNPTPYFGYNIFVIRDEYGDDTYVRLCEITFIQDSLKRWRKFPFNKYINI